MVKKHKRTANLFNASSGSIVVSDLEVHFGNVFLRLEEVLVAKVGFNNFFLDGFQERLEVSCERWIKVVQGEQEEHQACGCLAGLVGI